MNNTEIKTRHGLILQTLAAKALELAGYAFVENHQYDEISEVPDFLIPDGSNPRYMVEVHQTDARDSFRMKILRGFTAVTESKVHYTDDLVCVNILFGDPANEVPDSNLRALCGYFDLNIIPRYETNDRALIEELETVSLRFAGTENVSVNEGAKEVAKSCPEGLAELSKIFAKHLEGATVDAKMKKLWQAERTRMQGLGPTPGPGKRSYHKRNILRSLFFTDSQFKELITKEDPSDYSQNLCDQLVRCKLAGLVEQIWGDELVVESEFYEFIKDHEAIRLRNFCNERLNKNEAMRWYFEDIRDKKRRYAMVDAFLQIIENGKSIITKAVQENLSSDNFKGITHSRCWIADLFGLFVSESQNEFNRLMVQTGRDPKNYQYPFNHITGKFERLLNNPDHFSEYAGYSTEIFFKICADKELDKAYSEEKIEGLSQKLLELRLGGAIKLQRFNPLFEVMLAALEQFSGIYAEPVHTKSMIFDLAGGRGRLGKFNLFHITDGTKAIILNAVAVKDQNGDHKSKEWGARRRAVGYRMRDGKVQVANFDEAVFIIDGNWEAKHVERLHRAGWTRIIRLDQVEDTFREVFDIQV